MTIKRLVVGNWKMNGNRDLAAAMVPQLMQAAANTQGVEVVVCPPFVLLNEIGNALTHESMQLGAQDCHAKACGAYTGDVSADMLCDAGCRYVILGHSERREHYGETDATVAQKASTAIAAGLVPIICVGESWEQRQNGEAEAFVARQTLACLPEPLPETLVIAYEPRWAIGSGQTATLQDITVMHEAISQILLVKRNLQPEARRILYGGSVNAENVRDILDLRGVDGVLVGGASINADQFCTIIAAASVGS
ncbi:MAG: triose-phosphate isomerase [Rickettsiales bacterium]|nr:triose-phosphate isomerase [Rickettsiales bacterium]